MAEAPSSEGGCWRFDSSRGHVRLLNRILWWFGVQLVPRAASVKALIEYANALDVTRPVGPSGAGWIRGAALTHALTESDKNSDTVREFLFSGGPSCAQPSWRQGYGPCILPSHERGPHVHLPEETP